MHERYHYVAWNSDMSANPRPAYGAVYPHRSDNPDRENSPAYHRRRFIVSAVSVTSSGALEGLGKGIPSLLISLCRYVVVIIPTAFLLSSIFGAVGVWNAFWITEAITAIISICVYYKAISQSQRSQSTVK